MQPQPVLVTERLSLRPFQADDAAEVQALAGVREVAAMTYRLPHPYPDGMAEAWITSHAETYHNGREANFAITLLAGEKLIGSISLMISRENARAEVGFWLGKPFWGQGYATEALQAVLAYGFNALKLNRIFAQHFGVNPASGRVMEKAGMAYEGHLRQHVKKWGQFEDIKIYAILAQDFFKAQIQQTVPVL